jgi:hypothetical protein
MLNTGHAAPCEPLLILNAANSDSLPRHFRTCQDPFEEGDTKMPSREGLDSLRASGSGQFSEGGLAALLRVLPAECDEIIDVDLRQEFHGFVNGNAVSWYAPRDWMNIQKTSGEIAVEERELLSSLTEQREVDVKKVIEKNGDGEISQFASMKMIVCTVASEAALAKEKGIRYERIYATDHVPPEEEAKAFCSFVSKLPPNSWLHLHCAAGGGRTTTFMCLLDMMKNAKKVSFEDILKRQRLIGGADLTDLGNTADWKYPYAKARLDFLRKFYDRMRLKP